MTTSAVWSMTDAIVIDRRQRVAAVLCLAAIDLPQPAGDYARHVMDAAKLCPGITMNELPDLNSNARRACLERARGLIDEMLAEIPSAAGGGDHVG